MYLGTHAQKYLVLDIVFHPDISKNSRVHASFFLQALRDPPFLEGLVTCALPACISHAPHSTALDEELFCDIYSFRPFKLLLLDNLKMSFSPGDLIWAKMRGYPHWPARVSIRYFGIKADESEGLLFVAELKLKFIFITFVVETRRVL